MLHALQRKKCGVHFGSFVNAEQRQIKRKGNMEQSHQRVEQKKGTDGRGRTGRVI